MIEKLTSIIDCLKATIPVLPYAPTIQTLNSFPTNKLPNAIISINSLVDIGMRLEHLAQFVNSDNEKILDIPKDIDGAKVIKLFLEQIEGKEDLCGQRLEAFYNSDAPVYSPYGQPIDIKDSINEVTKDLIKDAQNFIKYTNLSMIV